MSLDKMIENIDSMTVGLDDTFKFHCDQCGKCCTHREDIILSPMDVFRLSRELNITPVEFYKEYCVFNIGENSRIPIIRLASVGRDRHCVLLKDRKCSVHKVKPTVCGMYPLGRYICVEPGNYEKGSIASGEVKYLLQPITCGDESETHTVREWLSGFDIKLEDEAFIRWHQAVAQFGSKIRQLEKKLDPFTMMEVWLVMRMIPYMRYDTSRDFMPQFEENIKEMLELLDDIPRLKMVMRSVW